MEREEKQYSPYVRGSSSTRSRGIRRGIFGRGRNKDYSKSANDKPVESKYSKFVVHCKKADYSVYIGRKNPSIPKEKCDSNYRFGNPFKISKNVDRDGVVDAYREYVYGDKELFEQVKKQLKGKVLGCWCSPLNCHGLVLAEVANDAELTWEIAQSRVSLGKMGSTE